MQTAIGTVLGGMAAKSENPGLLRQVLDLLPSGSGDVSWSSLASAAGDAGSPLISAGRRMLPALFGGSQTAITQALGTETGLPTGAASSLMAMAAPIIMSYFARRLRGDGMTMGGLGNLLQREIPVLKATLPASLVALLWPREREAIPASPVIHQTTTVERSSGRWVLPLILLALIPGLWWLSTRARKPMVVTPPPASTGMANREIPEIVQIPKPVLPAGVDLYFDTGSYRLRPDSQARLDAFANALKGNVHVMVNGYTDDVGEAPANVRLSQARANAVVADLERRGLSADVLTAKGFGEENPIADNNTEEGRAKNRRVSVGVAER